MSLVFDDDLRFRVFGGELGGVSGRLVLDGEYLPLKSGAGGIGSGCDSDDATMMEDDVAGKLEIRTAGGRFLKVCVL
ncbi:MAG: hypothetical protein M1835_006615 [Candelina submexicana]|nr:MAG: hypothetical protein M1835_006615 [Candelina submexicana]